MRIFFYFLMWETIETLYHATIEAMSNKKGEIISNTQPRM